MGRENRNATRVVVLRPINPFCGTDSATLARLASFRAIHGSTKNCTVGERDNAHSLNSASPGLALPREMADHSMCRFQTDPIHHDGA